jgi:hypothetical protein
MANPSFSVSAVLAIVIIGLIVSIALSQSQINSINTRIATIAPSSSSGILVGACNVSSPIDALCNSTTKSWVYFCSSGQFYDCNGTSWLYIGNLTGPSGVGDYFPFVLSGYVNPNSDLIIPSNALYVELSDINVKSLILLPDTFLSSFMLHEYFNTSVPFVIDNTLFQIYPNLTTLTIFFTATQANIFTFSSTFFQGVPPNTRFHLELVASSSSLQQSVTLNNVANISFFEFGGFGEDTIGNITLNSFPSLEIGSRSLTSIGAISGSFQEFDSNGHHAYLEIYLCPRLSTIGSLLGVRFVGLLGGASFQNNNLTSTTVSQILIDFDVNNQTGITLALDGGTNAGLASLSTAGTTAYNNLLAKSWNILINP